MIRIRTNLAAVVGDIAQKLVLLQDRDKLLRAVASNVLSEMKIRIHTDGKNADGAQIGTYSDAYMKVRTGDFKNAERFTKGKKKGKIKSAGVFTEAVIQLNKQSGVFTGEDKVGKKRPSYNRTNDKKVICSLTRNMENDMKVLATPSGYGIGYSNDVNAKKVDWLEDTYNQDIFTLSDREKQVVTDTVQTYTTETLQ